MSAESKNMTCQEFVELVTDYLEGRMLPEQFEASAAHLEVCDGCSNYVEQMRQTVRALRDLVPGEVSPETRERILAAFAER